MRMSWNHTLSPLAAKMAPGGVFRGAIFMPDGNTFGNISTANGLGGNRDETTLPGAPSAS